MKIRVPSLILIILLQAGFTFGQSITRSKPFSLPKLGTVTIRGSADDPDLRIERKVLPKPHPGADRRKVREVKNELEKYRADDKTRESQKTAVANAPTLVRNFNGNNFNGFVPNDNDMAISNGDIVCSVTNTSVWSRDQVNNMNYGTYNLHTLTASLGLQQEEFDPKIIYDPQEDRFIMVCLNGFTDSTSSILVGFSQGPTSFNSWNFYALPGNPLNNNLWTDFPIISLSDDELFITVNLLYNDSTWQAGFNQSVIWQVNKNEGYSGQSLNPLLHYDIKHNNEPLRNLCPVKGGSTLYGPNMYFLSNRNFTAGNDTIFLLELSGTIGTPSPTLTVTPLLSNIEYRMPIDAQQPFTDLLIVNDARILGGFIENNKIQFVFNMLDTIVGKTGIYHGTIDVGSTPSLNGNIYTNDTLYLAYPNISYAGSGPGENNAIVSVLISSSTFQPGTAAFHSDGTGLYSPLTVVKAGISYTNMIVGSERWGDYTGCQTRYNMPGYVWVGGSYSIVNHTTRTWIGELTINSGVSIAEINQNESTELFPNPVSDRFEMKFDLQASQQIKIDVIDAKGSLVRNLYRGNLAQGQNSFTFSAEFLKNGAYTVVLSGEDGKVLGLEKLIRQ